MQGSRPCQRVAYFCHLCRENISAFNITLDQETLEAIDAIHLQIRNPNCTD
jgi:hypothetical protein